MAGREDGVNVHVGATTDGLASGMSDAVKQVQAGVDGMKGHFEGLTGVVEQFQSAFMRMTAVVAGGALFAEAISTTKELTGETKKLSMILGISNQDAHAMAEALGQVGSSTESMISATTRITMNLRKNEEAFTANKVATRDANGEFLNAQQVISNVTERLKDMQPGYERNALATQLLGRNWASILPIGKVTEEMLEHVKKQQEELNSVVTTESIEAVRKYGLAMNELRDIGDAVALNVGNEMIPRLTALAEWFSQIGPVAVEVTRRALQVYLVVQDTLKAAVVELGKIVVATFGPIFDQIKKTFAGESLSMMQVFANTLKLIELAAIVLKATIVWTFEGIRAAIDIAGAVVQRFADIAEDAFTMNWSKMKGDWDRGTRNIEAVVNESANRLRTRQDEFKKEFETAALASTVLAKTKADDKPSKGGDGRNVEVEKGADDKAESFMKQFEEQLARKKLAYMKEHDLREFDKADEEAFWNSALEFVKEGSDDYIAIKKKMADAEMSIYQKIKKDRAALERENASFQESQSMGAIQREEQIAARELELGNLTKIKKLEAEEQFEQRKLAIQMEAQQQRIAQIERDSPDDPAALLAAKNKLLTIQSDYARKVEKINDDMQVEIQSRWKEMLAPINSAISTSITGMIAGTTTMRRALANLWQAILGEFVSKLIMPMVSRWAAAELAKTSATQQGSTMRWILEQLGLVKSTAAEAAASASTIVTKKIEATQVVPAEAAEAAGGAASAVASIPIVGPAMAAAAYAETFAMVMGGLAFASSAGGEWRVPQDRLNLVHKDETILPAREAQGLRDMVEGGAGGGGMAVHIHATDAQSVARLFRNNGGALFDSLRKQRRNFKA